MDFTQSIKNIINQLLLFVVVVVFFFTISFNSVFFLFQTLVSLSALGYVHLWDMTTCQAVTAILCFKTIPNFAISVR